MNLVRTLFEGLVLGLMAAWTLGSLLYAFPSTRIRRRLNRFNRSLWFANWAVFGAAATRSEVSVYVLEYRDRNQGQLSAWTEAAHGRPWRWHACLWQPGRRVADRIHRIGRDVALALDRGLPVSDWMGECRLILGRHLLATRPLAAGMSREVRLRARTAVLEEGAARASRLAGGPAVQVHERLLLQYSIGPDGDEL